MFASLAPLPKRIVAACAVGLILSNQALAQQQETFRKSVDAAMKSYADGKFAQAEAEYKTAYKTVEKGTDLMSAVNQAVLLSNLGTCYFAEKKWAESETAYKQSLAVQEKLLDGHHDMVADTLRHYEALLKKLNRNDEAHVVESRAAMLDVKDLLGSGNPASLPILKSQPAAIAPPVQVAAEFVAPATQPAVEEQKPPVSIVRLVRMSAADKNLLANPTTYQKPVYRTETYYEGGGFGPGGAVFQGTPKTRQVMDHYETVSVTSKDDLAYVREVADLQKKYRLSDSYVQLLLESIDRGGCAIEMDNGWLLASNEDLDPSIWSSGERCQLTPSYQSGQAMYTIKSTNGRKEFQAQRVSIRP